MLTPRERLQALPVERQVQLLDPAEHEFAEHGYEQASINRILKQAGMSKGQAYHYIAGKADLYYAVMARAMARLTTQLNPQAVMEAEPDQFWEALSVLFARVSTCLSQDERLAALARRCYDSPQSIAALKPLWDGLFEQLEQLLRRGQVIGVIRQDLPLSLLAPMVFAMAREADQWFALHWPTLTAEQAQTLNQQVVLSFQRFMGLP